MTQRAEQPREPDANGWLPIESTPRDGTRALLFFPQHIEGDFDGLDYSWRLAIFRNGQWRDQGTNHESFEGIDLSGRDRATHWQPLPAPPVTQVEA